MLTDENVDKIWKNYLTLVWNAWQAAFMKIVDDRMKSGIQSDEMFNRFFDLLMVYQPDKAAREKAAINFAVSYACRSIDLKNFNNMTGKEITEQACGISACTAIIACILDADPEFFGDRDVKKLIDDLWAIEDKRSE